MTRRLLTDTLDLFLDSVFNNYPNYVFASMVNPTPIDFKKEIELPGVKKEEVVAEHDGLNLLIRIDNKRYKKSISFRLPSTIYNTDKTSVTMADGLLEIIVPLKEKTQELKQIEIK
jgi:hypothetical protein